MFTGSGDVVVNLSGKKNTVNGGNGNDTVNILSGGNNVVRLGTGADRVVEAAGVKNDIFVLTGSNASLVLKGANDLVFIQSGTDTIADQGRSLELEIGAAGGVVNLSGFGADKTGLIDLVGGIGGFKTPKAMVSALQSDGHGGTLLSFGSAGQIDFLGVPMGTLKVSSFQIG